jgi:filamentous hemagglutinin
VSKNDFIDFAQKNSVASASPDPSIINGAAANAQNMANLVNTATNGMGTVQYSTHETDWVGLYIGLNPATGGLDSYEFPWSHSSYVGFLPPILMSNGSQNNLRTITDQAWGDGQINQPQIVSPTN